MTETYSFQFLDQTRGWTVTLSERWWIQEEKINAKTLSKIIALLCRCTVLILKSCFTELTFKVMVISNIDSTDVEKP